MDTLTSGKNVIKAAFCDIAPLDMPAVEELAYAR
jgi:hypothetical protein